MRISSRDSGTGGYSLDAPTYVLTLKSSRVFGYASNCFNLPSIFHHVRTYVLRFFKIVLKGHVSYNWKSLARYLLFLASCGPFVRRTEPRPRLLHGCLDCGVLTGRPEQTEWLPSYAYSPPLSGRRADPEVYIIDCRSYSAHKHTHTHCVVLPAIVRDMDRIKSH